MQNKRQFLVQGLLLTAVSFLLRAVGVTAQVYISAKIGAEVVGISALVGGVNGFAVTLALSGIHLGCTRLISQGLGRRDVPYVRRAITCAIWHALSFGLLAATLLGLGAPLIGARWLGDQRTVSSLRLIALGLPAVALSSCFSGYFTAVRRVWKSACIQVMEEVVRIGLTILLLARLGASGPEAALLALALAGLIADLFSCGALLLLFLHDRHKYFPKKACEPPSPPILAVAGQLLSVTLPVAVAAYARSGLITLEHMLIPIGLQRYGNSHSAALASYGTLHGMALPVVLFPCAVLGAFAGLLIPEMTEAHVRGEMKRIRAMMRRVFSLTLIFSIGTAGIMVAFSRPLGLALYHSEEAAYYIRVLAPLIPVMYMDSATDAMLKALGQQVYSMNVNIADASLSLMLVWLLLPRMGIGGYVLTIYVTELLNAALSIARLLVVTDLSPRLGRWVVKPLLAMVGAGCLGALFSGLVPAVLPAMFTLPSHIILTLFLYIALLFLLGALDRRDVRWMAGFLKKEL